MKDFKNNGTTWKLVSIPQYMSTNVMGFQYSRTITNIFCILILVTKVDLRP
jgi:hypothetical protein